jgi:hypothetical protein
MGMNWTLSTPIPLKNLYNSRGFSTFALFSTHRMLKSTFSRWRISTDSMTRFQVGWRPLLRRYRSWISAGPSSETPSSQW